MKTKNKNSLVIIGIFLVVVAIVAIVQWAKWDNANKVREYIQERTVSTEYEIPENISSQSEFDKAVMDLLLWTEKQYSDMEALKKEAYAYNKNERHLDYSVYKEIEQEYIDKVEEKIFATLNESLIQLCASGEYGEYEYNSKVSNLEYYRAAKAARDIVEKRDYKSANYNVSTIMTVFGEESACSYAVSRLYPDIYKAWYEDYIRIRNIMRQNRTVPKTDTPPAPAKNSYSTKPTYSTKKPHDTYDDGYEDVWLDGEPDWDRYESDPDYALGVDDAMDEFDW